VARAWYKVPLANLLHPSQLRPTTRTTTIGGTLFRYAWQGFVNNSADNFGSRPQIDIVLNRNSSSCKSITFSGGAEKENSVSADPMPEVDAFREGMSEVRLGVPLDSVATLSTVDLPLHRAFVIKVRTGNNGNSAGGNVWLNGYAYCYTKSGSA
jgi:hypothetical protein